MAMMGFRKCHLVLFCEKDRTMVARIVTAHFTSELIFSRGQARQIGIQMVNQKLIEQIDFDQLNVDIIQSPLPDKLAPRLAFCNDNHDDIPGKHFHWFGSNKECSPPWFSKQAGFGLLKLMAKNGYIPIEDVPNLSKTARRQKIPENKIDWDHHIDSRMQLGKIAPVNTLDPKQLLDITVDN